MCKFNIAWVGKCKKDGDPFCDKHASMKCAVCRNQATRECPETGQFVCGEILCDDCEHTIFPEGHNGGVGFNAMPLPEGMKHHCRKAEQKYQPWYMREEMEADHA
jgi:hypothetical protein